MKVSVICALELDSSLEMRWEEIRAKNVALSSPYFTAQFTKLVAEVRSDVFVGIIEESNKIMGFFPFQRKMMGRGIPVGEFFSDYQGFIVEKDLPFSPIEIIKAVGLSLWEFDHFLASQYHPYSKEKNKINHTRSIAINLSKGISHYQKELKERGSNLIEEISRKRRKIEKEIGALTFLFQDTHKIILENIFDWKSAQCQRTGSFDFFQLNWTKELIKILFAKSSPTLKGVLSTLFSDDKLIAAHFGMQSGNVLHWWFPVYHLEYKQYSPGTSLLFSVCEHAEAYGITFIDLGKGEQLYKDRFTNWETPLVEGTFIIHPFTAWLHNVKKRLNRYLKKFLSLQKKF